MQRRTRYLTLSFIILVFCSSSVLSESALTSRTRLHFLHFTASTRRSFRSTPSPSRWMRKTKTPQWTRASRLTPISLPLQPEPGSRRSRHPHGEQTPPSSCLHATPIWRARSPVCARSRTGLTAASTIHTCF
jgi:hypothetical protein